MKVFTTCVVSLCLVTAVYLIILTQVVIEGVWRSVSTLFYLPCAFYTGEEGWRSGERWERSPPTSVSRVRFLDSESYVGWVCCWFSSLLREVFLRVLQFSLLLKNQHFKLQFDLDYCQALYREPLARVIAQALLYLTLNLHWYLQCILDARHLSWSWLHTTFSGGTATI